MNRTLIVIVTGVLTLLGSIVAMSEAQTVKSVSLTVKQQGIVPIAAFTARGDLERLKTALKEGLDSGLTINEIKEILVQMYAYAGFPRSLNGIGTFMSVLEERQSKGSKMHPVRNQVPCPQTRDRCA